MEWCNDTWQVLGYYGPNVSTNAGYNFNTSSWFNEAYRIITYQKNLMKNYQHGSNRMELNNKEETIYDNEQPFTGGGL